MQWPHAYQFPYNQAWLGQNCLFGPKENFLENFGLVIFVYLLHLIMLRYFTGILQYKLWCNWAKIAKLAQKKFFEKF